MTKTSQPWNVWHCHTDGSLLDGLSKPKQVVERCVELGYSSCAITDHGAIWSVPSFLKECKEKKIKGVAGCEFYISPEHSTIKTKDNGKHSHLCVLAKNKQGWKQLVKAVSYSNRKESFYRRPRLSLPELKEYVDGNLISFSGHMGSDLANCLFIEPKLGYAARNEADAKHALAVNYKERLRLKFEEYKGIFGQNFFIEIQLVDHNNLPASVVVAETLREFAKKEGWPCLATADSHYCRKEDAADQRILLCSAMQTTLREVQSKLDNQEEVGLGAFFRSNNYHIPSYEEMREIHTEEELKNAVLIGAACETYDLSGPPLLPKFPCPDNKKDDEYLRELCRQGWKDLIQSTIPKEEQQKYADRIKHELGVLTGANLSSYFLIYHDIIKYARDTLKCLTGKARGSAGGCLTSYLTGITWGVDPVKHDLIFERFYNEGRNTKDRVALPDIDSDFPIELRHKICEYIRSKYGHEKVAQMCTFGRIQGRAALKEVLRAHSTCPFEEMNKICENIPGEAEISDDLQEMVEDTGESSIIRWALENNANELRDWCFLDEKGDLQGPLASLFAQGIRLEGVKKSIGKHPSGIVVCSENIAEISPMVHDKNGDELLIALDMRDAENAGLIKLDVLGTLVCDREMAAISIVETGLCN